MRVAVLPPLGSSGSSQYPHHVHLFIDYNMLEEYGCQNAIIQSMFSFINHLGKASTPLLAPPCFRAKPFVSLLSIVWRPLVIDSAYMSRLPSLSCCETAILHASSLHVSGVTAES